MNILILAPQPFYQPRGTPIAVKLLAETLAAQGHKVHLLVFHEGIDIEMPGVTLHRSFRIPWIRNIPPGFSFKKVLCDMALMVKAVNMRWRKRYDVVHAVEESAFIAWLIRCLFGTPYIFDMDSSIPEQIADKFRVPGWFQKIMRGLEAFVIQKSAGVVAVCKSLESLARSISPGVPIVRLEDISLLDHRMSADEDLRELLSLGGQIVLYVGNLEGYQGIDLLLESFVKTLEQRENVDLVVIGGLDSDIDHYRKRASELAIEQRTHFLGVRPVEKLGGYLRQADVLVSPRIKGGNTPMKIYSYLDSGRPVLATRLETHTQVLDETIAMLADPDAEAFANAMIQLLNNSSLGTQLAENARCRVAEQFSLEAFSKKVRDFYENVEQKLNITDLVHTEETGQLALKNSGDGD